MKRFNTNSGFSLVEVMVMTLLMSVILTAGSMVYVAGQNAFSLAAVRAELQENTRRTLQRISFELQESGRNNIGVLQVTILNGQGVNGTDILRFTVPLCVCGLSPIDSNGDVSRWGAPLTWGQAGCSTTYPTGQNGKVDVCHYPPGNPNNTQNLNVSVNAVKAHLAHGDYIGTCNSCDPVNYTNRTIEYLVSNTGQLLRRVLDTNNAVINSVAFAENLTDFQVALNGAQTAVNLSTQFTGTYKGNRTLTISNNVDVILRNGG